MDSKIERYSSHEKPVQELNFGILHQTILQQPQCRLVLKAAHELYKELSKKTEANSEGVIELLRTSLNLCEKVPVRYCNSEVSKIDQSSGEST